MVSGTPGATGLADPAYPRPELAWLPGYLLYIGRDMIRNAESRLGRKS